MEALVLDVCSVVSTLPASSFPAWYLLVGLTLKWRSWHTGLDFHVWIEIIQQRKEQSVPVIVAC